MVNKKKNTDNSIALLFDYWEGNLSDEQSLLIDEMADNHAPLFKKQMLVAFDMLLDDEDVENENQTSVFLEMAMAIG